MRKIVLLSGILLAALVTLGMVWLLGRPGQAQSTAATRFAAATANQYATQAAIEMLRSEGSAVDAAIAAQLVLTLVEPQSSGIGGGLVVADAIRTKSLSIQSLTHVLQTRASFTELTSTDGSNHAH